MEMRDIVVVGASAGGVEALTNLMRELPEDFPAAIFVVLHISEHGTSVLPAILSRAGSLRAYHPEDGETIQHGVVYVAPSDRHLLIEDDHVRVVRGPRENNHRPAIDPLFRSAARSAGRRAIGVVLSGLLDDGTAGLMAIKRHGGLAIVQSPEEAAFTGMVQSAIANTNVDHVMPVAQIAESLVRLTREPLPPLEANTRPSGSKGGRVADVVEPRPASLEADSGIAVMADEIVEAGEYAAHPSPFSCPECNGVLWEIQDGSLIRYRCRTGHAFSSNSLLAEQSSELDSALWSALRALEENASLALRLRDRSAACGHRLAAARFGEQADEAVRKAAVIRRALLRADPVKESPDASHD